MDFTSDSRVGSQSGVVQEDAASSSSSSELNPEHERLLRLQDVKDSLLAKRNALVKEMETLQSKEPPVEFKRTALLDLAELVPTSGKEIKSSVGFQDGSTAVPDELRYKHDCLPLLNMDLRLSYLRDTYPYASLMLIDSSNLHVEFTRRPNDYFQLDLQLPQGPALLSTNVRWPLRKLENCSNPTAILQGCYEFDRLRCRRDEIFQQIWSSLQSKGVFHRISGSLLSLSRNDLLLQLRLEIEIKDLFPQTHLNVRLFKNEIPLSSPDVQDILQGLMQEYGVMRGVLELCKSCFI
ncbi:ZYRO0F03718p [Zygosaccharomyces rouxii]|uniref:ZYRO0F03718p n=1 Tax=Zygosaccharomyces rouxii (strain ATCC 2623 / CBS 732 / NBRC 1130 / NCYC 568 / NRRL Y-229) TaxID=559307 RepID=C5DXB6_ZYGRC|nr:uncharacterized protein ZYRO0F03718g [Zygosaccharomyces rouxii]CAR28427.1 ZYRO0F03718p [Zygosaccharomyces rouxii]